MAVASGPPSLLYPLSTVPLSCNDDSFASSDSAPKRHAACDECRKRKLKCSGDLTGCRRCVKQSLFCHYSIQKQMGRPPKKRLRLEDDIGLTEIPGSDLWGDLGSNPLAFKADPMATSEALYLCPPVYRAQMFKASQGPSASLAGDEQGGVLQPEQPNMPNPITPTPTPWPDFSTASAASSLLLPMDSGPDTESTSGTVPGFSSPQGKPRCTCLSYLYLCLSSLSTLTSFPITIHTICSLFTAARTARGVIRCEVCPQEFSTGMQNVMLMGTLLNVIADSWLRVSMADPVDLGKQSALPRYIASVAQDPQNEDMKWKQWLRQTVRHAVIGGPIDLNASIKCQETPDLLSLIKEMEARQRRWHADGVSQYEYRRYHIQGQDGPPLGATAEVRCQHDNAAGTLWEEKNNLDERDFLCLRVVGSAREVISKFGFEPHEYPEGTVS